MPLNTNLRHLAFNETSLKALEQKYYLYKKIAKKILVRLWSKIWPESPGEIVKYVDT